MDAADLYLTAQRVRNSGQVNIGRVVFKQLTSARDDAVQMEVEFRPTNVITANPASPDRFVVLEARSFDGQSPQQVPWGRWAIDVNETPSLDQAEQKLFWRWYPSQFDLEAIESRHAALGSHRIVSFQLDLTAMVVYGGDVLRAHGETKVAIPRTQWEDVVLAHLHYSVPPSWNHLLPDTQRLEHLGWQIAVDRLEGARRLLREGSARAALGEALDAFEESVSAPYDRSAWLARLPSDPTVMPQQKREATADLLHGVCTYLNRVGHHRARKAEAQSESHPAMPVDQWEAEYVLAATHFVLALALREAESRS